MMMIRMMVDYTMMIMTTDETGARFDDRAMIYVLSAMSHVLDRITDRS